MSSKTYNDAIDALNLLQTPFNIIAARQKAGIKPDASSLQEMKGYLARIGYSPDDLDRLNIVHVAGTKGKGSTCAFVDSILAQYQKKHGVPHKIGLFTSPHLIAVRERIRINSAPISEAHFARSFFEVWDRLEATTPAPQPDDDPLRTPGAKPVYARFLTLLSWHVFLQAGVDCAVYETGVGGAFDATNLVPRPLATGISTLGIDHVYVLGATLPQIAWHKAGIMKPGRPAFTVPQAPEAAAVLKARAEEIGPDPPLRVLLPADPRLADVRVRPDATFQHKNATLAVALAETALRALDPRFVPGEDRLAPEFRDGLEGVVWRGRCEVKTEDRVVWHIDGAHTVDSLKMAARWFVDESAGRSGPKVLVFNQQGRTEAIDFLDGLCETVKASDGIGFKRVIFCTNVTFAATGYKRDFVNHQYNPADIEKMTAQRAFAERWLSLDPDADIRLVPSIEEALNTVRGLSENLTEDETVQALVTGSLHLVGGALGVLEGVDAL